MRATIGAKNDDYEYEITLSDDHASTSDFVELIIRMKGEDYYETWIVSTKDLFELVTMFRNRLK